MWQRRNHFRNVTNISCCATDTWKTQGPAGESSRLQIPSTASSHSEFSLLHPKAQKCETQTQRADGKVNWVRWMKTPGALKAFPKMSRHSHSREQATANSDKPERAGQNLGLGPGFIHSVAYMGRVIYSTGIWLLTRCQTLFVASGIYCLQFRPSHNLIYFYFL